MRDVLITARLFSDIRQHSINFELVLFRFLRCGRGGGKNCRLAGPATRAEHVRFCCLRHLQAASVKHLRAQSTPANNIDSDTEGSKTATEFLFRLIVRPQDSVSSLGRSISYMPSAPFQRSQCLTPQRPSQHPFSTPSAPLARIQHPFCTPSAPLLHPLSTRSAPSPLAFFGMPDVPAVLTRQPCQPSRRCE